MSGLCWWAIVLAGGDGTRMGAPCSKVLLPVAGEPAICRTLGAFRGLVQGIVLVCRPADEKALRAALNGQHWGERLRFTAGGGTRQASVWQGLQALPEECDAVLVHDGARCLVDADVTRAVQRAAADCGSAVASVPVSDSQK